MTFLYRFNQFLWSGPALIVLLGLHLYHTCHLRLIQRKIGQGIRLSLCDGQKPHNDGFSRFGSLATTLAATLGTGNIVGVSTAVWLGGPGAIFWCWITGVLGMATTYAETYLCTRFRSPNADGRLQGGPMHVLASHLHKPVLALFYSAALCLSAFFIGCTTQSNAITETCLEVFHFSPVPTAILTAFVVGLILMQGKSWIEKFSVAVVPSMAAFFLGGCVIYLILHADYILPSLHRIITSAFGLEAAGSGSAGGSVTGGIVGGITGITVKKALRYGIARGLFTNEAGLGTAGLVAGSSAEEEARHQGLISMSATFWDTVVLCAVTGIVLTAYQLEYPSEWIGLSAGSMTAAAFSKLPFFGDEILAIAIICFALATLVGWSYFGRQGFDFLFHGKYRRIYQSIYIVMIFVGGVLPLTLVWELTDFINLFLLIPALYMLIRCRKEVS